MNCINNKSRMSLLLSLEWESDGAAHRDELWTDQVNMWRDCLLPEFAAALEGRKEGQLVSMEVTTDALQMPYSEKKVVQLPSSQFQGRDDVRGSLVAVPGRFYPQGLLHGLSGVFNNSVAPARCIASEKDMLHFDLNHPLATYDLLFSAEIEEVHPAQVKRGGRCEDWLEKLCNSGPGMQARYHDVATDFFGPQTMARTDTTPDHIFYTTPRMVHHLDATARDTISTQYGQLIAPEDRVLDLMGSWDSHLPLGCKVDSLTVLGLNETELAANAMATDTLVRNLNKDPEIPAADNSFDAVICTASIEYLTSPLAVFAEIQRVLCPGGVVAVAFTNRWFPTKAVQVWPTLHEFERLGMVLEMFHQTPGFDKFQTLTSQGRPRPQDDPHPEYPVSDPVFIAWGYKGL